MSKVLQMSKSLEMVLDPSQQDAVSDTISISKQQIPEIPRLVSSPNTIFVTSKPDEKLLQSLQYASGAVPIIEQGIPEMPKSTSSPPLSAASNQGEEIPGQSELIACKMPPTKNLRQKEKDHIYPITDSSPIAWINQDLNELFNETYQINNSFIQRIKHQEEIYQRNIATRDKQIQRLKAKLDAVNTQEKALHDKLIQQNNHKFHELQDIISKTNEELQYTSKEITNLREELTKTKSELSKTEIELFAARSSLTARNKSYETLSEARIAQAEELGKLKVEKESSENKLRAEITRLQQALETQKRESEENHSKAQEEISYLKENIKKTPRTLSSGTQTYPESQKKSSVNKVRKPLKNNMIATLFTSASDYLISLWMIQSTQRNLITHAVLDFKDNVIKMIQSFIKVLTNDSSITQVKPVKEENNQFSYNKVKISKDATSQQFSLDLSNLGKDEERIILARRLDDPNNKDIIYIKGTKIVNIVFSSPHPTKENSQYFNIFTHYSDNLNDEKIRLDSNDIYSRPDYILLNAHIKKSNSLQKTLIS